MLTYYANRGAELGYLKVATPELDSTILVYGSELTRAEAHSLVKALNLEEHLVSDVFDDDELPRIEVHDDLRYVFLRSPRPVGSAVRSNPVLIIIGHHLFACLSATKIEIDEMAHPPLDKKHIAPPLLMIEALAAIAKRYESLIDSIGTTVDQTETRLHSHEATNKDFIGFVTLEGNLSRSRMNLSGIEAVTERLIDSAASKADKEIMDDIKLFLRQLLVEVDSHVQAIESIRNAYTTVA
ncbi:MAG: CorA family divalent cation transporter, partial [Candidatus Saccharimonadaceae bacterium]